MSVLVRLFFTGQKRGALRSFPAAPVGDALRMLDLQWHTTSAQPTPMIRSHARPRERPIDGMSVSKLQVSRHWGRKQDDRKDRHVKLVVWRTDPRISRSLPLTKRKIQTSGSVGDAARRCWRHCTARGHIGARRGQILWGYIMMRRVPIKCELCVLLYSCETRNRPFAGFPRAARFRAPRLQRGRFY